MRVLDVVTAGRNPVLSGCYPDPSVCRVGEDYFLVTSSFEYFPGLPVFTSTDLTHWRQIGHAIDRSNQLDLSGVRSSGGLYAATIRHHDGVFYIVNTLVDGHGRTGNFVITATDAAGPWSDPHWLDEPGSTSGGIDPSLFFDDDGRCWYTGTRLATPGEWDGQTDVWLREFDLTTLSLVGPEHVLWHGALLGAVWAEGSHLYRVDDRYHLLIAEGGTEQNHAVSVARAETVTGPYIGNPGNPVLTHRNLGRSAPIVATGHADLVQSAAGEWSAVLLASRPYGGYFANLGRETFVVPVVWEDGWPVFAPGIGRLEQGAEEPESFHDDFDGPALDPAWNQLRTGAGDFHALRTDPPRLSLALRPQTLAEPSTPSFLGRRQRHRRADVWVQLDFEPISPSEEAGLALRQSEDDHYLFAVCRNAAGRVLRATRRRHGETTVLTEVRIGDGPIELGIAIRDQDYELGYRLDGMDRRLATVDGRALSSTLAGGFLGVWIGLYATSNGRASTTTADFAQFRYDSHEHPQT